MIGSVLLVLLLFCSHAWAAQDLSGFAYDQRLGNRLPLQATFRDQDGHTVTLGEAIEGRPTILALGYFHCPNLCGLVRDDLFNALSRLEGHANYSLVALSIDPTETPQDALTAQHADDARYVSHGHYLTGSASSIRAVAEAVGFQFRYDDAARQFLHPSGIVFLSRTGVVSGYLLGLGYQARDVQLGITRAEEGMTARALPVLLLCFHYDPVTGRYTLATMRLLQLGAAITVIVLGGTIALALRRERS
jgi:protein SCO1/2